MNHSMSLHMYKAFFVGTIFIWALSLTRGSEYEYMYDNNETCIDVKMDVLFTLSNGYETVKFDSNNFTVKSGDCAIEGEYQAVLTLTNANEDLLALTFNTQPDLSVNLSSMFTFAPFEFFPGTPIATTTSLLDTGDLTLGANTQLYQCVSTQRITLTGELEGTTYTMYMDMSNVQIQAFNIKDGNLSTDVFVCSADQMTTIAQQTTESNQTQLTTEPYTIDRTSNEPATTSKLNRTTESTTIGPHPPLPPKTAYKVMKDSTACLIMEGRFQLKVTYMDKGHAVTNGTMNFPESSDVIVTGTCAIDKSSLTITPQDGTIKCLTFNFQFNTYTGKSMLTSWFADVNLELFPDSEEAELNHTVNYPVPLSDARLYYKCDVGGTFADDTLAFIFTELRVQAFNVEDGKFSENGEDCEADVGPIPASGSPPVNTYSVSNGNETCVVFQGSIQFNIPYISKTGITTKVISLPAKYSVSGECNTTLNGIYSQQLVIGFYDIWELTMYFSSDMKQETDLFTAEEGVTNYHISQIELKYDYNNVLFKDADDSIFGKEMSVVVDNLSKLTTDKNKSYKCGKEITIHLEKGLSMVTKDLQYQAFKAGNSTDFSTAVNCEKEEDDEYYTLYIAIGAAVGGCLLVVVVVATVYILNKRRKYETLTL